MRFVWAVAAFVVAAVLIVAGIAQRTVFQGPTTETTAITTSEEAPYLLIDGAVLNRLPGSQTLRTHADGDIFMAYGRTADMQAWLSDAAYNSAVLDSDDQVQTEYVEPEVSADAEADAGAEAGAAPAGRSPVGSDLWLDETQQTDLLIAPLQLPEDMSVLIAMDGTAPAPAEVTVSWPISNGTPLAGPLILLGGILMAVGVWLYILGIQHVRRSRGPRRKGFPMPVTEPIDVAAAEGEDKGVISSTPSRRSVTSGRRSFVVIPAVAVSALLFTGCAADAWPELGTTPTPSPTATVAAAEGQQAPAVTKAQAERILAEAATVIDDADEARDETAAATRMTGPALEVRATNYLLRSSVKSVEPLDPIVADPIEIVLPQAYDGWPRSVMTVVDDAESKRATISVLVQEDPWTDYKLSYVARLEASTLMPDLAPAYIGAPQVQPDSPFLVMAPQDVATAYSDVINSGEDSEYFSMFDEESDVLRTKIAADRAERVKSFNETATKTGKLTFTTTPGDAEPFALATLESGAIVAVTIHETDKATSTDPDAVIKLEKNPTVKKLTGVSQSAKGFSTTYSDQVFFYVPGQGSSEKIRLLGYSSDVLDAKVIK